MEVLPALQVALQLFSSLMASFPPDDSFAVRGSVFQLAVNLCTQGCNGTTDARELIC